MITSTDLSTRRSPSFLKTRAGAVIAATLGALVVNLIVWLIGLAAGGSFELTDAGKTMPVAPGGVVMLTVLPLIVGLGVAALISLRFAAIIRVAEVIGVVAALGTIAMTVQADFDTVTTVALAAMHVVVAFAVVAGLESIRRAAVN